MSRKIESMDEPAARPAAPKTLRMQLVISPSLVRKVDAWRGRQEDVPNRSKAIRLLIEHSLEDQRQEA
jgi:metal-responsive CopG/Arc/MetJ family transcriptional regulator